MAWKTKQDIVRGTLARAKKFDKTIHHAHSETIVSLLIEELAKELEEKTKLTITNLGAFELIRIKPRYGISVVTGKRKLARETQVLRFRLDKNFKKYLLDKSKGKV